MKNIYQLHIQNNALFSKCSFYKKEIDFLLKLIQNEYSRSINQAKSNILDSYWEMLEKTIERLNFINLRIQHIDQEIYDDFQSYNNRQNFLSIEEERNEKDMDRIACDIRTIKDSFFEFIKCQKAKDQEKS